MIKRYAFIILVTLTTASPVFAATKNITLKDGSVIKGELVSYQNGVYTLQTENLGRLQLPEANVVSVSSQSASARPQQAVPQAQSNEAPQFSYKVAAMQNKIMADPGALEAVQAMAEDPEIAALVSDPDFVKQLTSAVNSDNVDSVGNDPRIQKLMANPKMQALIQQLQQGQTSQ